MLTHGVELRGNRYYLTINSVQHEDYPEQKKTTRIENKITGYYFEPMADGTGVKSFTIMHVNPKHNNMMKDLQSTQALKRLLLERRDSEAKTTYLQKSSFALIEE